MLSPNSRSIVPSKTGTWGMPDLSRNMPGPSGSSPERRRTPERRIARSHHRPPRSGSGPPAGPPARPWLRPKRDCLRRQGRVMRRLIRRYDDTQIGPVGPEDIVTCRLRPGNGLRQGIPRDLRARTQSIPPTPRRCQLPPSLHRLGRMGPANRIPLRPARPATKDAESPNGPSVLPSTNPIGKSNDDACLPPIRAAGTTEMFSGSRPEVARR